ncbi:DUF551 domain-containing protein [Acinetobacter baumannii]|uniref:DUF551 domain-containing protein n=1 Tax=Acinetobacter baumannii TaxID=470 RepID=UPI0024DEC884|nr:DUF551 domain-containing protein [Acinetobacter baumannii]MDK2131157.1 DUF551 domain-containing protein [Acinetobacter baumannii]MDK2161851.1 DUF551 domain-containing protein [Acinetobacter baumannii]MDK2169310.1 DUF551 domain-containing protein [Acinetobacter baumannii]MDK2252890.1 DUF551 domain-containing protein [Acinetobacter baumannii]MDK2264096.1 DUF551 domain-containing protein [Acinetobacter baumannii]
MTDLNKESEVNLRFEQDDGAVWVFADDSQFGTEISHLMMMHSDEYSENELRVICQHAACEIDRLRAELEKAKAQAVPVWISAEVGRPIKFGTRVKIKRKAWDEDDNLIIVESEATYDKDSDFCELSNRSYEYETWFDHELKKYLDEDELTHWAPLDKSESGAEG